MAKPRVVWTETAVRQRREIFRYWTQRNSSPAYAKKLLKQIRARIDTLLSHHPEASVLTNFPDTRMAALGHFSLFYKYIDNQLIITAFWDNRQDPKKLKELLDKSK